MPSIIYAAKYVRSRVCAITPSCSCAAHDKSTRLAINVIENFCAASNSTFTRADGSIRDKNEFYVNFIIASGCVGQRRAVLGWKLECCMFVDCDGRRRIKLSRKVALVWNFGCKNIVGMLMTSPEVECLE